MRNKQMALPKNNCYICKFLANGFWCDVHIKDVAGNPDKTCHCFEPDEIESAREKSEVEDG